VKGERGVSEFVGACLVGRSSPDALVEDSVACLFKCISPAPPE
jgi:hypothetical protein